VLQIYFPEFLSVKLLVKWTKRGLSSSSMETSQLVAGRGSGAEMSLTGRALIAMPRMMAISTNA
jgi:hypothetical protein